MGRDRSLDEFSSQGSATDETPDARQRQTTPVEGASMTDSERGSVDPMETAGGQSGSTPDRGQQAMTPVYGWTPDGAECVDCGTAVTRRWQGDEGLVCPNCKTW